MLASRVEMRRAGAGPLLLLHEDRFPVPWSSASLLDNLPRVLVITVKRMLCCCVEFFSIKLVLLLRFPALESSQ